MTRIIRGTRPPQYHKIMPSYIAFSQVDLSEVDISFHCKGTPTDLIFQFDVFENNVWVIGKDYLYSNYVLSLTKMQP
jgi:hypothetical protein